ncbi:hypothetical protein [Caulobacter sp. NIBR2454]|uniref:hypothetical protein n=1 Tax=Caulobacter sp. NIBR2454 TaxID=3015996 RepID=UPI0022B72C76|nr:hypothetical protein [Caulobacter sp. NIBR2454]
MRIVVWALGLALIGGAAGAEPQAQDCLAPYTVQRMGAGPIITPAMLGAKGGNINGPSLIRAPKWLTNAPGKYLLYFAHHEGEHIRLAYADALTGPWKIYGPGMIHTKDLSWNTDHVASPDIIVDDERRQIRLYFHTRPLPADLAADVPGYKASLAGRKQTSHVAISTDGLNFTVQPEPLGPSYFRVWRWGDAYYALPRAASPLLRSQDGLTNFIAAEKGPFDHNVVFKAIRHVAVMTDGDKLSVFYSRLGDAPEQIFLSTVQMTADWRAWKASEPMFLLAPETKAEGADLPLTPSRNGKITFAENALRDPAIFREDGRTYLLYAVQGELGVSIAELEPSSSARP